MVRVHFNPARTDKVTYQTAGVGNGLLATPTGDSNNEYSFVNEARSQMKFRINLKSVLGKKYYEQNMFSIRLTDVKAIQDANNNSPLISHVSPAWIRTSNLVMTSSNVKFIGGNREIIMGQVGNFDPNEETSYELEFHRGDLLWNNLPSLYIRCNNGGQANRDGQEWGHTVIFPFVSNPTELQTRRFRWNYREQQGYMPGVWTDTTPSLEGKNIIITNAVLASGSNWLVCNYEVVGETNVQRTGSNFPITLTTVPNFPTWYMYKRDPNILDDEGYGIEAWFHKPETDYIDITLEIRDMLMNKLQPVMDVPNDRVLPPFTFVFDIN